MFEKKTGYMGGLEAYAEARIALLGAPLDVTTSFRPGTRFGPERVRQVSEGLEEYSPAVDKELSEARFYDLGNVAFAPGALDKALEAIEKAVGRVLDDGKMPVMIGGEHLVTLPAVRAASARYPELAVIQLDAHADLRADYLGERFSHACVMRRIVELLGGERVVQLGIRSGPKEEFAFGKAHTHFFPGQVLAVLDAARQAVGDRPVWITIDIDVVDPAFGPGTGTPEPGGITSAELLEAVRAFSGLQVVGGDVVEVCPPQDVSDITSVLAAKVLREAMLAWTPARSFSSQEASPAEAEAPRRAVRKPKQARPVGVRARRAPGKGWDVL